MQAAVWPDGYICQNCYRKAIRTKGQCILCGHNGVLPGETESGNTCRSCSGIVLNVDCVECGAEDELYSNSCCWACALAALVNGALGHPETGVVSPALVPFADALKGMKRANSGLTWIRQSHVKTILKDVAKHEELSHEVLDRLPSSNTVKHVRALLVEHGALPWRDEFLENYLQWSKSAIKRLDDSGHIKTIEQFVTWHQERRLRETGVVTRGQFLRAKQDTTVAIDFLNWIHQQGYALETLSPAQYEEWKAGGTTTRLIAVRFLRWAMKSRLAPVWDERQPRSKVGPRLSFSKQQEAIEKITKPGKVETRDRAVGILVLVFAQPMEKICQLTHDNLTITKTKVTVRLGKLKVELPPPLDEPFRELVESTSNRLTATHANSKWLFPGIKAGLPINAGYMLGRIKKHFPVRAARTGSLAALVSIAPAPVIAEALGYHPTTVEAARNESATKYSRYIQTIQEAEG